MNFQERANKTLNVFSGLKMKYPREISIHTLRDELKSRDISFSSLMQSAYQKAGVITRIKHGYYIISPELQKIVQAFDIAKAQQKVYQKTGVKVKVFNAEIDKSINVEMCIEFLTKKGYFIHKIAPKEKIQIIKTICE